MKKKFIDPISKEEITIQHILTRVRDGISTELVALLEHPGSLEEIEAGLTAEGLAENAEAGGGAKLGSGPLASRTPSSTPS